MEIDEVGILRVPKIMKTFAKDEFLELSMKVIKTNEYGNQHGRYFVLTNKRILLLNKSTIRRKVPLEFLIAITLSVRSFEFVLHFKDLYEDDDLRLVSERRSKLIENIVKTYSTELNSQLASFQVQDLNLKKYVTYKQDRKKNLKKMPTENVKFLFYKPIMEENERKDQLQKVHQTISHNKLQYSLRSKENFDLNDFVLLKILNQGSVAQIILVENQQTKLQYAMKAIPKNEIEQLDVSLLLDFSNYQPSPFLVRLEYCYEAETKLFFVQSLMKCDLYQKLQEFKKFPESKVKFYACEILLALEHIHQKNLVYGDLKPENVLLDAVNHMCLCDFGYMRAKRKALHGIYATPEYIAPETLINHQNQLYYSDYWQFGVLLYECLYSHPPFIADEREDLFDYILNCQVEFSEEIPVSDQCKDLISKLLQKDPKNRLGYNGGVPEIQAHGWFADIDWKMRYDKLVQPPEWRNPNLMDLQKSQKQQKVPQPQQLYRATIK